MTFLEALLLSLALCIDSLVVSAATALSHHPLSVGKRLLMAVIFGLCQAVFPIAGALVGSAASAVIESVDHWVSFALLAFVGGRMLFARPDGSASRSDTAPLSVATMLLLGVATSLDAFAVGISLGLEHPLSTVLLTAVLIGVVTIVASFCGSILGSRRKVLPERVASIVAGLVLIGLGLKILLEPLLS